MKNLEALIESAAAGDDRAFAEIIRQFQDMAFGYAYSLLGDLHLAEDAAQEAFVEAYVSLRKLKNPSMFPGWFRRIVQFRCSRFTQRKQLSQAPLQEAVIKASSESDPYALMERKDIENAVLSAVNSLSQPFREVTTLFYINGYSRKDIAEFLEIPVNTVRSRLSVSRDQLKRRLSMNGLIKETFGNKKPGDNFVREVIDGMLQTGYDWEIPSDPKKSETDAGRFVSFPACLCICLEKLGENYGTMEVPFTSESRDFTFRVNNLYTLLMASSGAAFRLNWNPDAFDDYSTTDILKISSQPLEPVLRAFEAVGYECEIFGNSRHPDNILFENNREYDFFKDRIIRNIREKNRPVIAFGIIGPPEDSCIITGFDDSADVLIGTSIYQKYFKDYDKIEFEPSGYFRQRDWFRLTRGMIFIGEKKKKPSIKNIYRKALENAAALFYNTDTISGMKCGMAAYQPWIDMILNDKYFPADNQDVLKKNIKIFHNLYSLFYESRDYACCFLMRIGDTVPELKDDMQEAINCYSVIIDLCWQIRTLLEGKAPEHQARLISTPDFRKRFSDMLVKARDKETEAIGIIEKVLEKW